MMIIRVGVATLAWYCFDLFNVQKSRHRKKVTTRTKRTSFSLSNPVEVLAKKEEKLNIHIKSFLSSSSIAVTTDAIE